MGLDKNKLMEIESACGEDAFSNIINHAAHLFPMYSLLREIKEGSGRISQIVVALKNYSYLGQAPVDAWAQAPAATAPAGIAASAVAPGTIRPGRRWLWE
jgi:hypothetical protein